MVVYVDKYDKALCGIMYYKTLVAVDVELLSWRQCCIVKINVSNIRFNALLIILDTIKVGVTGDSKNLYPKI
jgi:hypothetical protein